MRLYLLLFVLFVFSCAESTVKQAEVQEKSAPDFLSAPSLVVLGTVQDGGSPHIGCAKDCCLSLFPNEDSTRKVVALGLIDPENNKTYLIEATPDITAQMKNLKEKAFLNAPVVPDGIFLTHAHIGHYTGLMYLGKEALNSDSAIVYTMPRMKHFLEQNGPWGQLVSDGNITIQEMAENKEVRLTPRIGVTPILVPHRDEYSETVGYKIRGPNRTALFIPDIDKWEKWEIDVTEAIAAVDYAFLDASFYDAEEINNRDISQIPHPFVIESLKRFKDLPAKERSKIYFIHFNHTNPLLNPESPQARQVLSEGYGIAEYHQVLKL